MTIYGGWTGSGEQYYPPQDATLAEVANDISLAQGFEAQEAQLIPPDTTALTAARATLTTDIAAYQSLLEQNAATPGSVTQSQLTQAKSTLQTDLTTFSSAQTQYYTDLGNYQIAANEVTSSSVYYQQLQLTQAYTDVSNIVTNLFNANLDQSIYGPLSTAQFTVGSAGGNLSDTITSFMDNEMLLEQARTTLSSDQDQTLSLQASALLSSGLEPSPAPTTGPWAAYEAINATIPGDQTSVSNYLTQRTNYENSLNSKISAYQDSLYNSTTGFVTLLQQAAALPAFTTDVTNYIQQIATSVASVDSYMSNILSIEQAQDTADAAAAQQTEQAAQAVVNSTIDLIQSTAKSIPSLTITLPALPSPGKPLSMMDLMRFIVAAESSGQQLQQQAQQADVAINNLRIEIWGLVLQKAALANILIQYDTQVSAANSTAYINAENSVGLFNENLTNINNRISLLNAQNAALSANGQTVATSLNTAAQDAVSTINSANSVEADTINTLNLFNLDTPPGIPTPLPDPTPVTLPSYPQFPPVTELPPTPDQFSTPAQVAIYNAQIQALNEELTPISSQLDAIEPGGQFGQNSPPHFQTIPPLFYGTLISLQSLGGATAQTSIQLSLQGLYNLINQALTAADQTSASTKLANLLAFFTTGFNDQPRKVATTTTGGFSIDIASAETDVSSGILNQTLNEILSSQLYATIIKNMIDRSTVVAAITTGLKPPGQSIGHSFFGLLSSDDISSTGPTSGSGVVSSSAEVGATNEQLEEVARQLLNQLANVPSLQQNAALVIAGSNAVQNLTSDQLKALSNALVATQQVVLLLLAGVALGAIGASTPDEAAANLASLAALAAISSTLPGSAGTTTTTGTTGATTAPGTTSATGATGTTTATGTTGATTAPGTTSATGATGTTTATGTTGATTAPGTTSATGATGTTTATGTTGATAAPGTTGATGATTTTGTTGATGTTTTTGTTGATTPPPVASLVSIFEAAGLTATVSTQLAAFLQAAITTPGAAGTSPVSQADTNALLQALQQAGFNLPAGFNASSPDLLATILNQVQIQTTSINQAILNQGIAQLIAQALPTESTNIFNGAIQAGTPLGDAIQDALNAAQITTALTNIFQSSNLSQPASSALALLVQASLNPSSFPLLSPGSTGFNSLVATVTAAGINIPTNANPNSPAFIADLFDAIQNATTPANSAALTTQIAAILTSLNLPQASVQSFQDSVANGASLGEAINTSFASVPGNFLAALGINLNAIPTKVLQDLQNQIHTILSGITNLTRDQKTELALAIGVGIIKSEQAAQIARALVALQSVGASPDTISLFVNAFRHPKGSIAATGDPNELRHPSTMPVKLVELFKEKFANLVINHDDLKSLEKIVANFAQTVVTQTDFYQFSLFFLLGPAQTYLKNFNLRTAQSGSQGQAQTPNQLAV